MLLWHTSQLLALSWLLCPPAPSFAPMLSIPLNPRSASTVDSTHRHSITLRPPIRRRDDIIITCLTKHRISVAKQYTTVCCRCLPSRFRTQFVATQANRPPSQLVHCSSLATNRAVPAGWSLLTQPSPRDSINSHIHPSQLYFRGFFFSIPHTSACPDPHSISASPATKRLFVWIYTSQK